MFAQAQAQAQSFLGLANWRKALYAADLTPTAAKVGAYLSDRVHSVYGYAWPHIKTIAAETRLALATVKRALRELKRSGLIVIQSGLGWRSSRYWCVLPSGVSADTAVGSAAIPPIEEPSLNLDLSPTPAPAPEPAQVEREKAQIDSEAPVSRCEPLVGDEAVQVVSGPDNGSESDSEALEQARAVIVALIAASGANYSQERGSGPMKAAEKALRAGFTVAQIKLVISWCASTWSNRAFLTPTAVLKVSKLDERLAAAQAQAPAGTRAACHRLFEPEQPVPRTDPSKVAGHLSRLRSALAAG